MTGAGEDTGHGTTPDVNDGDVARPPTASPDAGIDGALLHARLFDGAGGARPLAAADIARWTPAQGVLWVHADFRHPDALALLERVPGLDGRQSRLLVSEDTRPSTDVSGQSVRITLRGVNLHPESNPEDMVSLRLWAGAGCLVSTRRRHLLSVDDVLAALAGGHGPCTPGELLATLAARLVERMQETVDGLDERVTAVEEAMDANPDASLRGEIADIRRATIILRRHLAPQREALAQLASAPLRWLGEHERAAVRDALDELQRHVEDLDSTRERATVAREELAGYQTAQTNARMYALSILSAVFLPLGFVTGLLGVNLGGIPGANDPRAFAIATVVLLIGAAAILLFLRRRRWL